MPEKPSRVATPNACSVCGVRRDGLAPDETLTPEAGAPYGPPRWVCSRCERYDTTAT